MVALTAQGKDKEALALLRSPQMVASATAEQEAIDRLIELKRKDADARAHANTEASSSAVTMLLILVAGGHGALSCPWHLHCEGNKPFLSEDDHRRCGNTLPLAVWTSKSTMRMRDATRSGSHHLAWRYSSRTSSPVLQRQIVLPRVISL